MEPIRQDGAGKTAGTVNRRTVISGAVAAGVSVATHTVVAGQAAPQATPEIAGGIDAGRVMMVSANLCGGARLKEANVDMLLDLLNGDADLRPAFEELETIEEFTEEAMAAASPEAQALATNILQYWFLGRYDGELVENRAEMFFDLACWQPLPYSTQQSTCKSFGYWAVEIDL